MRLEDLLHEQAAEAPLEPATFASVAHRARVIRRRRTVATTVGAVAAASVLLVLPPVLMGHTVQHAEPSVPSPTALTSTAAPGPSGITAPLTVVTVQPSGQPEDRTFGNALLVPYWSAGQLIAPDGTPTPLAARPEAFAYDPQARQWAVTVEGVKGTQLVLLAANGQHVGATVASFPRGVGYDPNAGLVRITRTPGGRWTLVTAARTFDLGAQLTNASVDGFEANGDVRLTIDDEPRTAHLADGTVEPAERALGFPSADLHYTAVIGDPGHVIPGSHQVDADGASGAISIVDPATRRPIISFLAPRNGVFGPWAWEGEDIAALVFERSSPASADGTWTLVRLYRTGYLVGRSASWPGRIDAPPYLFETNATSAQVTAP